MWNSLGNGFITPIQPVPVRVADRRDFLGSLCLDSVLRSKAKDCEPFPVGVAEGGI